MVAICAHCAAEGADCLTREGERVCETCLCEVLQARIDDIEAEVRRLVRERDKSLDELEALQEHIREHLPYKYDDGEDDDASPEECVEYAAREIRALKATNESLQQSFDEPDGGPMARAIARSNYHVEQQAKRKAEAERDEALTLLAAERSLGGRCQCGDDVCRLARERDEARAALEAK